MNESNTPASNPGDPNARVADTVIAAASSESTRSAAYGALLVFIAFWTTPWVVIKRSLQNLSEWGRARALPTTQSELPVLTYLTIIGRPFAHLLWIACWVVIAFWRIFGGGQSAYYGYSFGTALLGFLLGLAAAYFGQYLVGLAVESMSITVRIANNVQKIANIKQKE